ncbi:MAG: hypothetical protein JWN72_1416 [Thermoleophilia bacterium]|nr:hypothetical protein [Thermoleophilia bacterium]
MPDRIVVRVGQVDRPVTAADAKCASDGLSFPCLFDTCCGIVEPRAPARPVRMFVALHANAVSGALEHEAYELRARRALATPDAGANRNMVFSHHPPRPRRQ